MPYTAILLVALWAGCATAGEKGEMLILPDLGRRLSLGNLYDARSHKPVSGSLWSRRLIDLSRVEKPARSSKYEFASEDTFSFKSKLLDISGDLAMSFMGGDVKVEGSARFLKDKRKTAKAIRMSLMHNLRTVKRTVDPFADAMMMGQNLAVLGEDIATHVVTGVTYGANTICTFESPYASEDDKATVEVELKLSLQLNQTTVDVGVGVTSNRTSSEISQSTRVSLNGDLLPPNDRELPTKPEEALKFMRQMHTFAHGEDNIGVAMTLELTPLTWLFDTAAKLQYQINKDIIERAVGAYESLDRSEELILDLLAMQEGPFRAWKDDVEAYYRKFLIFRTGFAQKLGKSVSQRRNGTVPVEAVAAVLDEYFASSFSDITVAQTVEEKRDTLLNLLALVKQMRADGVTMAQSYSDFLAPTFDSLYDKVYALVLVGMIPSADREGIARVRQFAALAEARRSDVLKGRGVVHCVERQPAGHDKPVCVERLKFVVIHFDSFCEEFCHVRYCPGAGDGIACPMTTECSVAPGIQDRLKCWERTAGCNASNPEQVYGVDSPLAECFCACPRTQVLEFAKSQSPVRADNLPVRPLRPVVQSVEGADEAEEHPLEQRVTLHLDPLQVLGVVRNFRVRVLWYEAERTGTSGGLKWVQRERIVETRDNARSILISGLASGERYRFEVAGANSVGDGAYSEPTADIYVSHNRPLVVRRSTLATRHESEPLNQLPGWRSFNGNGMVPVTVGLSTPAREKVAEVHFFRYGALPGDRPVLSCEGYGEGTEKGIDCTVPVMNRHGPEALAGDEVVEARVVGVSGELLAWGNVTLEAPTARTCEEWEETRWLLCDTEIEEVIDAEQESGPMHQVVVLRLNGSTHERELLRFRVQVFWKEAGVAEERSTTIDTNTDLRDVTVTGLAAGQTYQFQVAGVDVTGAVGPYTARFPRAGFTVGSTMPVVTPKEATHHSGEPENNLPAWFFDNKGKLRVTARLSTVGDEPLARVEFEQTGRPVVHCANYGQGSAQQIDCTLPVGRFAQGVKTGEVRVYGINGAMLGKAGFTLDFPGVDQCYLWEPSKRTFCNLTKVGGAEKCVGDCTQCTFNEHTTEEFSGECRMGACPTSQQALCPDTGDCFHIVGTGEQSCHTLCSPDTAFHQSKGLCAVPCRLSAVDTVVPAGGKVQLNCLPGYVISGQRPWFTCPSDNTEREEERESGKKAKWSPSPSELPSCRKCDMQKDCTGRAASVYSTPDRSECKCQCLPGYKEPRCDSCSPGYVRTSGVCWHCTVQYCYNHASRVDVSNDGTQCLCTCLEGWEGARCNQCKEGYYGSSCHRCTSSTHCNGHGSATSNSDRSGCVCSCNLGYSGTTCGTCASGYTGYPNCNKIIIVTPTPPVKTPSPIIIDRPWVEPPIDRFDRFDRFERLP